MPRDGRSLEKRFMTTDDMVAKLASYPGGRLAYRDEYRAPRLTERGAWLLDALLTVCRDEEGRGLPSDGSQEPGRRTRQDEQLTELEGLVRILGAAALRTLQPQEIAR